jgi:hypothetical protein|tara:strand:+ start:787 stop:1074 length:288 start_codon:yes stop_codon:yes gene_type:complete
MSKSIENLILLQSNIEKLKLLIIELKNENLNINNVLNSKDQLLLKQTNDLKQLKEKYQSLKMANTFLVSNDKSLTKLKINNMIKDLDRCIMNLSS